MWSYAAFRMRKVQKSSPSFVVCVPYFFARSDEIGKGTRLNMIYSLKDVLVISKESSLEKIRELLLDLLVEIDKKLKK